MKNIVHKIKNRNFTFLEIMTIIAPTIMWFSYFPNLSFGKNSGMNIKFTIPMFFIAFFALVGARKVYQNRKNLIKNRAVWLCLLFVMWNFISVIWSENKLRTIFTSAMWLVIYFDFLVILSLERMKKILPICFKAMVVSAVIMSILAILQVVYGAFTDYGLCAGCLARGFGFVRPSVFTIEPQFFGNLLIAPIIICAHRIYEDKRMNKIQVLSLLIMLIALYLTLSRGAIFAVLVSLIVLSLIQAKRRKFVRKTIFGVTILSISFIIGMLTHAIFTQLNPRVTDGFADSISKSINQLSLGKISIKFKKENTSTATNIVHVQSEAKPKKAIFNGYVEKSTDERTSLSNLAIQTWKRDLKTMIIGVGEGSAGKSIYDYTHKTGWISEIVQNEYVSILFELGIVGILIWISILIGFIKSTRENKWVWAILAGFLAQWIFFSGLPSALHIYIILAILFTSYSVKNNRYF